MISHEEMLLYLFLLLNTTSNETSGPGCISSNISCNNRGICQTINSSTIDSFCQCINQYDSFHPNLYNQCNYVKKIRKIAIGLHASPIYFTGAGYFYTEQYFLACVELMSSLMIILMSVGIYKRYKPHDSIWCFECFFGSIFIIYAIGSLIGWYIGSLVAVSNPSYKDGNGMLLY